MSNLTKRIVSVILAMIMILGTLSAVAAADNYPFSDFPDGWSKEAMEAAVDNGLLTGMGDGTIAPKDNLTRAQMAAIINRAFGAEIAADISGFSDVPQDAWYRDDIALAVNMQTFTGEGNGVMNPESDITRQEAFAVLARALVIETNKSVAADFTDGGDISAWAVGDVSALVANGYVNGYPDGTLDPLGNITREEFAQVMHNIFKTYISAEGTVDSVNDGGVMINKPGVTLTGVTVNGDLVLGDGVGKGSVTLENVKILGRLLCRGGEDKVTLKDTTTTGGVVVKDVNGVVNFNNYRSEAVFDGVREITRATYLTPLSDDEIHVGPSRKPSSSSTEERTVRIYEDSTLSSLIKTIKLEKGSKLFSDLPSAPSRAGYIFDGWYYNDSGTEKKVDSSTRVNANMTVYGKWKPASGTLYTVRHVKQNIDGTYTTLVETETLTGTTGETTAAAAKTYEGFTAESFSQKTIAADDSTVVEIRYKRNTYTIRFDSNGGSAVGDVSALYEAPVTKPSNPTKTGYKFVGWYADSALTTPFDFSKMPLGGATAYARWASGDDVIYTVRHVRQNIDGTYTTLVETETLTGTTGEATAAAAKTYEGFTAQSFSQKIVAADGSTVVEIRYKRNTYMVKYYKDSALTELVSSETVIYEASAAAIPAAPTAPGKVFAGWYYIDSALGETAFDGSIRISGDTDVYAKWTNMYNVSFYMDETLTKPEIRVIQAEYGSRLSALPADPTKDNYEFDGWAYVEGGVEKTFDISVVITSDIDVYAKWKLKKYTVYFYNEYSAAPDASILEDTYEAEYGTTVPKTEIPASYENGGYVKNSSVDPVYTAEYKHKIPNEWWYFDADSGEWKLFDDTVPVKSDINVFDMTKNVSFMFDTGRLSAPVSVTVPYNSHTRFSDTFKDILYAGRNSVKYAFDHTDAYNKLIGKLADPKLGIIDEHGNILNQKLDIGIYEIISPSEIDGEIKNYLETLVKNGGDDLKSVLAFVSVSELVSAVGTDTIINYVDNAKLLSMVKLASMRTTLVDFMKDKFANDTSFRNETVAALTNILTNDNEAMLSLAAYVRSEYNNGNPEIVNFVHVTMHIPDLSYVDDAMLAAAMKTQAPSMPEFMAQYIIYRINMNDPKIDECVNKFIDRDMDAVFVGKIKSTLSHDARIESIINKYLDENSAEAETLIVDYVDSLSDAKKEELADKIFDKISGQSTYKNFIKAFEDKSAEFVVTPDSVSFLLGVANAVNSYTYEGLRDKFRSKFGSLIDLIGEETVKVYFNSAKEDYYNGAAALADRIKADKLSGTAGVYSYKTSLTFKANLMRDVLVPKYRASVSKLADKLKSKEQVKYNDNVYLKALVEKDMISALFDTAAADEIHSGYKLKDDPMAYYDLMYAMVVLADDAVLYYDYIDYDTAFEKITPYAVKIMNKFIAAVDHFDKTGELPGGLEGKLSSISKLSEIYGAFEEMLGAAADEILASSINQDYTEGDFKNQSIKAATGFINLMLKQFNEFAENGKLPFKADALVERVSAINELYKKYGSDAQELAKKLAEFNFNHAYTEGEVASYEEYVKHVYTLLNEAEDPAFSVDDMYDIIDVFFGDILDKLEFSPDDAEGVINLDGYKAEAKDSEASVIRFYR